MSARLFPWVLRVTWAVVPFTAGPALAGALHRHVPVRTAASVGLWVAWTAVLLASLVAHPISLTVVRTAIPAAVAAVSLAAVEGHPSSTAVAVGLAWTAGVAVVAFLPSISMVNINGPAYGNERRYPLAIPGALLLGPIELAWIVLVGLPAVAVFALADGHWIVGPVLALAGAAAVVVLGRALHGLSRRWVVFVPAGLVLHDPLGLMDPVLFARQLIERLGPAPADSDALDLTQRAPGLALELVLKEKVPMALVVPGNRKGEAGSSARLLFTPTRPGAVLADAQQHRLPVATP